MYLDALIVGAGFTGLSMIWRLRNLGLSVKAFERADDIGGTWYYNQYPGARCDTESLSYQFLFQDDLVKGWTWSERYPSQPEILRYIHYIADKLDLRKDILLNINIKSATWDNSCHLWIIQTSNDLKITAKYFLMANGALSTPLRPQFPGLDSLQIPIYYSNNWPKNIKLDHLHGKRVCVIGTGSSGIQIIQHIAKHVKQLYVFQRTPNFIVPAQNRALSNEEIKKWKTDYKELAEISLKTGGFTLSNLPEKSGLDYTEEERKKRLESKYLEGGFGFLFAFTDLYTNPQCNEIVSEFVRDKIREKVKDQKIAELLCPYGYPYGSKRPPVDIHYFEVFNQPNVELIDISKEKLSFGTNGPIVKDRNFEVDVVISATGFDAWLGPLFGIDIRGVKQTLREAWSDNPQTYLGTVISGFPNLFMVTNGPQHPFALTNTVRCIEWHGEWISKCISYMEKNKIKYFDIDMKAQENWSQHCVEVASFGVLPNAKSWYVGSNVPGKKRFIFPYTGGFFAYIEKCMQVEKNDYEGFKFSLESRL